MSPHSVTVDMLGVKKFDLFDYGDSVVQKLEFSYCKVAHLTSGIKKMVLDALETVRLPTTKLL
jgi:hypothetical protein